MRKPSQRSQVWRIVLQDVWAAWRLASVVVVFRIWMLASSEVPAVTRLSYWGRAVLLTNWLITSDSVWANVAVLVPESEDLLQAVMARQYRAMKERTKRFIMLCFCMDDQLICVGGDGEGLQGAFGRSFCHPSFPVVCAAMEAAAVAVRGGCQLVVLMRALEQER